MKKIITLFFICTIAHSHIHTFSQPAPTSFQKRMDGFQQRKKLEENSLVTAIKFRNVGPTIMSGRVVDIEVNPANPKIFYVAYASGGLWKTENNGMSFTPIFDHEAVMTIGDIAVDWTQGETIWIGTGENNSSRSSYSGVGIYKSNDGGKNWQHLGLEETHHIGRIILHPTDPNTIWVAALGHLYSANKERGIFKTTDGGKSWKQTLFVNDSTGGIDLVIDPNNLNTLYAAMWQRDRRVWNLNEAGRGSGIYKSTDGGEKWNLISNSSSGFPQGENIGRIGLCIYPKNPNILYAVLDNQNRREKKEKKDDKKFALSKDTLKKISTASFLKLDDKVLNEFLEDKDFPEKYNAKTVKEMVHSGKIKPSVLAEYLEDANSLLFDTEVIGAEVYRSDDAGKTWKKTNGNFLDDIFYSYGYYFAQIRISPVNENKIYIFGVPSLKSEDGGKTFQSIDGDNTHGDFHAQWINPNDENHFIVGNDGGLNMTYDGGKNYFKLNSPSVGQFYSVNVDMETPYNVYGGIQDNGVWYGPSTNKENSRWHESGTYPFKTIMWGDGMQVAVDTVDNTTVYTGFQFGNYSRVNRKTRNSEYITPKHELGERPFRWNWQSPIQISKHAHEIIYFGSNYFHRSMNKGNDFKKLSGDLTNGGKKGDVPYGTITTIDESPMRFGLIYVGTDDGNIQMTKDVGYSWTKISSSLPQNLWLSRIAASAHEEGTVYASLNGYRWDDFNSYLFVSKNYGTSWEKIGTDLPAEPINVVKEDPKNPNILYVGTDHNVYVSLNKGKKFMKLGSELPAVAVHDLVIHPRENEIVLGTHGRSIWIASVNELQQLNDTVMAKYIFIFPLKEIKYSDHWGKAWEKYTENIDTPLFSIPLWLNRLTAGSGQTVIEIKTDSNLLLKKINFESKNGLNYFNYDLTMDSSMVKTYEESLNKNKKKDEEEIKVEKSENGKYYLRAGKYSVTISDKTSGKSVTKEFSVKARKKEVRE